MPRRVSVAALLFTTTALSWAAQPQFWRLESARDFLEGENEGIAIDSEGHLRLAPALRVLHDPQAPYVWSLVCDGHGSVYAGTGNEGKVLRIEKDQVSEILDAPEMEVHALAVGPDGRLYVGTSPDGKVYAVAENGQSTTFFDPPDKYIWSLVFDSQGNLLVATGLAGKVHRVDPKGHSQVVLTTPESHIVSLVADQTGNVYAGSSPSAILYRLDAAGKVFVLHDSSFREAKALGLGPDGSLYAALVDGKDKADTSARTSLPFVIPPVFAEIPGTEASPSPQVSPSPIPVPSPPPPEIARPGGAKGAVLRVFPTGEVETLWSSPEEVPHALVPTENGVLIGTGNKGRIFRIQNDRVWSMLADLPADQVTALFRRRDGEVVVGVSNPGKVHLMEATLSERGTHVSKPRDTETVSRWGRIRWDAQIERGAKVEIQTRSGNTATPDFTWSDWSVAYARSEGETITSPSARFLQVRAILQGTSKASPVLDSVSVPYLQRNLRPLIASITVHPPGEVFQKPLVVSGEMEILGLDPAEGIDLRQTSPPPRSPAIAPTAFSRRTVQRGIQTFTWKAEDPNSDALTYDVSYRMANEKYCRALKRGLSDAVLAWDTTTVPNGRYVVKVTASDAPSNPASLALTGERESDPFDIDNSPPTVTATLLSRQPPRIRAQARDDMTPIRRADYALDGGRWQEIHPVDGINDDVEETYEIVLTDPTPGPHVVVVRAVDQLGNVAATRVELP